MNRTLEVVREEELKPKGIYLRFGGNATGWAIIFLHDATGAVCIHSDYGDFAYSWPPYCRGPGSLIGFLKSADNDYLARKFCSPGRIDEFNEEASKDSMIRQVLESRREHSIDENFARILYDEIKECDLSDEGRDFVHNSASEEVQKFFDGEPWQYFSTTNTQEFLWLKEGLLPAIKSKLVEEMAV